MKISDVLAALKEDLRDAQKIQGDPALRLETCEIELQVGIEKKASGEINFSVLGVGAKGGIDGKQTDTHKVKLVFRPLAEATIEQRLDEIKHLLEIVKDSGLPDSVVRDFGLDSALRTLGPLYNNPQLYRLKP